jgi:hypothetical protein
MTDSDNKKRPLVGTPAYDNWRAFLENEPLLGSSEYLMYTDAWLTGEVATGLEPYRFFNLIPIGWQRGRVRAAVALRLSLHVDFETPSMEKTDQSRYHGGWMTDELAALASLKCGVRFRAGGETRSFDIDGDPQGRPVAWDSRPEPTLSIGIRGFVLPAVTGQHSMMPIEEMKTFTALSPEQAIALVRAARLYQDALWLAESEPNLSWLMLVAAVETAASYWHSSKDLPLERLRETRSEFCEYLEATGVAGLATRVANEFADSIGATKKFIEFLLGHLPLPPKERPAEWSQVDWSPDNLKKAFRLIYAYRSRALHDGMPFPAPMCEPPFLHQSWEAVAERPLGLAASVGSGTWLAKDTPMLLHTFEYIARNALTAWWTSMATSANKPLQGDATPVADSAEHEKSQLGSRP